MFSPGYIRSLQDEAAQRAAKENLTPYPPTPEEIETFPPFPFPFVGDYVADGWEPVTDENGDPVSWFVDISGLSADDEPALTPEQLRNKLRENAGKGYGYALTEIGQFQGHLGVFHFIGRKIDRVKREAKEVA